MKVHSLLCGALVLLAGCSTFDIDSKVYACNSDAQCGPDFKCVARVCVPASSDAGAAGGTATGGGTASTGGGTTSTGGGTASTGGGTAVTGGGSADGGGTAVTGGGTASTGGGTAVTGGGTASTGGGTVVTGGGTASTGGGTAVTGGGTASTGGGTASTGGGTASTGGGTASTGGGTASTGGGTATTGGGTASTGGGTASTGGGTASTGGGTASTGGGTASTGGGTAIDAGSPDAGLNCSFIYTHANTSSDADLIACGYSHLIGSCYVVSCNPVSACQCSAYVRTDQTCTAQTCAGFPGGNGCSTNGYFATTPYNCPNGGTAETACMLRYLINNNVCANGSVDAGSDAGVDAGVDAGTDAGVDAGFAPVLNSKNIFGAPSAIFAASITAGLPPFTLKFFDLNKTLKSTVTPAPANGLWNVVLPNKSGVYTTMLTDAVGRRSYGSATVNASSSYAFASGAGAGTPINPPGFQPYALWSAAPYAVGDVNADGFLDVLIGHGNNGSNVVGAGRVYVYRGSATGALTLNATLSATGVTTSYGGARFIDLDADGDLDVVATFYGVPKLFIAYNSAGVFPPTLIELSLPSPSGPGMSPTVEVMTMDVGDFDYNGTNDVLIFASAASSTQVIAWRVSSSGSINTATIIFSGPSPSITPRAVFLVDANDDGWLDVAAPDAAAAVRVGLGSASGISWTNRLDVNVPSPLGMAWGYINNDARPDYVMAISTGGGPFAYYLASNPMSWSSTGVPTPSEQYSGTPFVADINVDGTVDVLVGFRNRYLSRDVMGVHKFTGATLATGLPASDPNVIYGSTPCTSWTESNPIVADYDNDNILDVGIYATSCRAFDFVKGQ